LARCIAARFRKHRDLFPPAHFIVAHLRASRALQAPDLQAIQKETTKEPWSGALLIPCPLAGLSIGTAIEIGGTGVSDISSVRPTTALQPCLGWQEFAIRILKSGQTALCENANFTLTTKKYPCYRQQSPRRVAKLM
jgi:hypothetical protein